MDLGVARAKASQAVRAMRMIAVTTISRRAMTLLSLARLSYEKLMVRMRVKVKVNRASRVIQQDEMIRCTLKRA